MTLFDVGRALCHVLYATVWRIRVIGRENVPLTGPLIVVANHISYLDPPAVGVGLPRPLYYMAKEELFRIPVFGPLIARLNAYPVDRKRGDVAAIKRSVEMLKAGKAICIFPEGTRNKLGTNQPQDGAALLAALSGAPILPAYIDGTGTAKRLGRITVIYGEPYVPAPTSNPARPGKNKASREDLAKWTAEIMSRIFALREKLVAD